MHKEAGFKTDAGWLADVALLVLLALLYYFSCQRGL